MKDLAIYGAGGFGKEVACLVSLINKERPTWNFVGFFDDGREKGSSTAYGKILGGMADLNSWAAPLAVALAIGSPKIIRLLRSRITNDRVEFPNIIAPGTFYARKASLKMGEGNIIQRRCTFSCDVEIGDFNVLNGSIAFGHDARVGSYNVFMPNVRVSGEVSIGNCNLFGVNSCIIQQTRVGDEVRLGAGSVLMTKPKPGSLYIGVPARIFKY